MEIFNISTNQRSLCRAVLKLKGFSRILEFPLSYCKFAVNNRIFSIKFPLNIKMSSISEPERFPGVGVVIKETFLCVPVENSIIKTFFYIRF